MTDSPIDLGRGGGGLLDYLRAKGVPVDACYQCLRCTAGCPMLSFMDQGPNRIIRLVQYGLDEEVMASNTLWMCASCQTCTTRCPNEIEIAHVMDLLRQESSRREAPCPEPEVAKFHRAFVKSIRRGRVHELSLIGRYKLSTGRLTDDTKLGLEMFRRGRIKLLPERVPHAYEIKVLFKMAEEGE